MKITKSSAYISIILIIKLALPIFAMKSEFPSHMKATNNSSYKTEKSNPSSSQTYSAMNQSEQKRKIFHERKKPIGSTKEFLSMIGNKNQSK